LIKILGLLEVICKIPLVGGPLEEPTVKVDGRRRISKEQEGEDPLAAVEDVVEVEAVVVEDWFELSLPVSIALVPISERVFSYTPRSLRYKNDRSLQSVTQAVTSSDERFPGL
jgi:hypothetical protein